MTAPARPSSTARAETERAGRTRGSTTYNYRYNKRGRLDRLTIGSTQTADYTYDGLERLAIRATQRWEGAYMSDSL